MKTNLDAVPDTGLAFLDHDLMIPDVPHVLMTTSDWDTIHAAVKSAWSHLDAETQNALIGIELIDLTPCEED